jgi:hypothetical protein
MLYEPTPIEGVLRFLSIYSRLEYALKRSGCLKRNGRSHKVALADGTEEKFLEASPDWEEFSKTGPVQKKIDQLQSTEQGKYLLANPPKIQVAVPQGERLTLEWAEDIGSSSLPALLIAVRQVRHNLFHDGKWPATGHNIIDGKSFAGDIVEPSRDQKLVNAASYILTELAGADDDVRNWFNEYP